MPNIQTEIQNNYKRYRFDDSHKELKEEIINKILDNNLTLQEFYDLILHIIDDVENGVHLNHDSVNINH